MQETYLRVNPIGKVNRDNYNKHARTRIPSDTLKYLKQQTIPKLIMT